MRRDRLLRLAAPRYLLSFDTRKLPHLFGEVLVVGSGIAGLRAALEAARRADVLLVSKGALEESNTLYAQGGVASPLADEDSIEEHVEDTLEAGAGLCDEAAVQDILSEGPTRVRELIEWGVRFDREGERLAFTREGGHSRARVLHARGDATGREVEEFLVSRVRAHPRIRILERAFVADLLTRGRAVQGALVLDPASNLLAVWARETILATGGAGLLYRETTNPSVATGDGVAIAFRAGAAIRDAEMFQFHPTTLYVAGAARFLITEAARGEGGVLRDRRGRRFMTGLHPRAELAPRDVVSRGILRTMRETGDTHVYLDLTHLPRKTLARRFPGIREVCGSFGIDIRKEPIPVRPSAHYYIGGILTDLAGRTTLRRLSACGEAACTGLHGANRLASNSLLEGLVMGRRCGRRAAEEAGRAGAPSAFRVVHRGPAEGKPFDRAPTPLDVADLRQSIRSLVSRAAGAERSAEGLREARRRIIAWQRYAFARELKGREGCETQNLLLLARLVLEAALLRTESRGVHWRTDHPDRDDREWRRHVRIEKR